MIRDGLVQWTLEHMEIDVSISLIIPVNIVMDLYVCVCGGGVNKQPRGSF